MASTLESLRALHEEVEQWEKVLTKVFHYREENVFELLGKGCRLLRNYDEKMY